MYYRYDNLESIDTLLGKTLESITVEDRTIYFKTNDGLNYEMSHQQDCCESVYIEDIVGDTEDLLNSPILEAEEVISRENPSDAKPETLEYQDSFTWTFYKLGTIKGHVTIRWYGESNGYYSESVDFFRVPQSLA